LSPNFLGLMHSFFSISIFREKVFKVVNLFNYYWVVKNVH